MFGRRLADDQKTMMELGFSFGLELGMMGWTWLFSGRIVAMYCLLKGLDWFG